MSKPSRLFLSPNLDEGLRTALIVGYFFSSHQSMSAYVTAMVEAGILATQKERLLRVLAESKLRGYESPDILYAEIARGNIKRGDPIDVENKSLTVDDLEKLKGESVIAQRLGDALLLQPTTDTARMKHLLLKQFTPMILNVLGQAEGVDILQLLPIIFTGDQEGLIKAMQELAAD